MVHRIARTCFIPLFAGALFGSPIIDYVGAVAPNVFGSPNYTTWQTDAILAHINDVTSFGTPNTPGFFFQKTSFVTADMIVTDFPSWEADANPGGDFGVAYAGEFGNRITIATFISDGAGQVDIANGISINIPAFGDNPGISGSTSAYSARTVGVILNGSSPPTILTSGTGLVDFIATFPGLGFQVLAADGGATQSNIDDHVAAIQSNPANGSFTDCSTYNGSQNCSSTFAITADVPEPGTITLLSAALLLSLVMCGRRSSSRRA